MTESQIKVLKRINEGIPKAFLDRLIMKRYTYPTIREMVDRGLEDPEVADKVKDKLRILKNSQEYSATEDVVDEEMEKKIDAYLSREVKKAIKSGALPPLTPEQASFRNRAKLSPKPAQTGN